MREKNRKETLIVSATLPLEEKLALRLGPTVYRRWKKAIILLDRLYLLGLVSRRLYIAQAFRVTPMAVLHGVSDFADDIDPLVRIGAASAVKAIVESDAGTTILKNPYESPEVEEILYSSENPFWQAWIEKHLENLDRKKTYLKEKGVI